MTGRVGRFEVVRALGRGGMGVVVEVRDPRLPGRRLALKRLLPGADAERHLRFAREGQLLARVDHPGVVRVHGVEDLPDGPALLMDVVEGEPLDALRRRGPLPAARVAALVRDVAAAAGALHRAGVVHRDLKPENVLVRPDGAAVIVDFGLAVAGDVTRLTATGEVAGTPAYMAPEQVAGPREALDARVDVRALGGVLLFLLAGRPPFEGPPLAVLDAVARRDPAWPAPHDALEARLVEVGRRAMARDPAARPADGDALARALDHALAGRGPAAAHRWTAGAGAAALVAAGLVAAGLVAAGLAGAPGSGRAGPAPRAQASGTGTQASRTGTEAPGTEAPGTPPAGAPPGTAPDVREARRAPPHERRHLLLRALAAGGGHAPAADEVARLPAGWLPQPRAQASLACAFVGSDAVLVLGGGQARRWTLTRATVAGRLDVVARLDADVPLAVEHARALVGGPGWAVAVVDHDRVGTGEVLTLAHGPGGVAVTASAALGQVLGAEGAHGERAGLAGSSDGAWVALVADVGEDDGAIALRGPDGRWSARRLGRPSSAGAVAVDPDGAAWVGQDASVRGLVAGEGRARRVRRRRDDEVRLGLGRITGLALDPTDARLAIANADGALLVQDLAASDGGLATLQRVDRDAPAPGDGVRRLRWGGGGRLLVGYCRRTVRRADDEAALVAWDAATGELRTARPCGRDGSLDVSPDGALAVVAGRLPVADPAREARGVEVWVVDDR